MRNSPVPIVSCTLISPISLSGTNPDMSFFRKERLKGHGTMIGRVYSRVGIGFGFVGSGRVGFGFRFRFRIGFGFEVDQLELCA